MYRVHKNKKDILYILDNLRNEDKEEVFEVHGKKWKRKLFKNIMQSSANVIVGKSKCNDKPIVMGGIWSVCQEDEGLGCVWMLATESIKNHQICLLRELRKEIQKADNKYWLTFNKIYKANYLAKNWLKWLGYRFPEDEKNLSLFDKNLLANINIPANYELFYRIREVKGLGDFNV